MKPTVAPAPHLRRAGLVVTIAALTAIAFATLLPEASPAVGSIFCLVCGTAGAVSAILNVFLFAPLGVGLALYGLPGKRALLGMCALSVLIETAQFFVISGRYSTIGDVLTNSLGGALGFALSRYTSSWLRPAPRMALVLGVSWSALWLAIQSVSSFGFSQAIPRSAYYGQISPLLGDLERFHGVVVDAHIGDVTVPYARFADSDRVRELLRHGAVVSTTVVRGPKTTGIAPIMRIADTGEREIVLVAQQGDDLLFGVRIGAAVLRLRAPVFSMPDAFVDATPSGSGRANDTLRLTARYSTREVWVSARAATSRIRRIPIVASLGWTMFLPFKWFIEGTRAELVVSAIWIACLVFPIGYWGSGVFQFRQAHDAARIRMMAVSIAAVLMYAGLVMIPRIFGLTAALPREWLAALTGILSGAALAPHAAVPDAKSVHRDHRLPNGGLPVDHISADQAGESDTEPTV
jgi:hypothetical protein